MTVRKFHKLASLVKTGKELAVECDTVSFDLFDTLVIRRIHDPDLVKLPVARFIANIADAKGLNWSWNRVQHLRDTIEKQHRRETGKRFTDHEACYPGFMQETLEVIFGKSTAKELLAKVTDYELAMESSMLVVRMELVDWLDELKKQGKRIFIISDIYLPATHLERLVENLGLKKYVEAVISSADTFLAKASGKAFPLIKKKYDLITSSWLHVGDNPISDGVRPAELGIQSLIIHDSEEKRRKAIIKRQVNYSDGRPFWRGRALQQLMMPLERENLPREPLYLEGYNFFSPLICAFVQQIAERCRRLDITKVFFLSREGWTFKQVWDEITPYLFPDGNLPETEYLYVSRMALAGSSCTYQGLTKTNADITFLPTGNRDFSDVCRIFGLNAQKLKPFLQAKNLELNTTLSHHHDGFLPENRLKFNELLEDDSFQEAIKAQVKDTNDALSLYLEDVGFFDQKDVALVDIGWLGTIQRFFYEAIQHRDDKPRCHGFLFAATRGIPYPTTPDNYVEGLIYDRNCFDLAGSTVLYARDLFEEACRAPHPTLNGYRLTGDGYALDFRREDDATGKAEQEQDKYYQPLQQGILDGAKRYGAASALLGYSLKDYKPWFNYLMSSKLAFPKASEVILLRQRHHLDDFHGSKRPLAKLTTQKHLWDHSRFSLQLNPFLRKRFFLRHIKERLNE